MRPDPLPYIAFALLTLAVSATRAEAGPQSPQAPVDIQIVPASNVTWSPLNPARGAASPQAGALWGDRTDTGASGFLVRFTKGFSSPPHIHNITYRGVVISGLLHNDDAGDTEFWMPTGSFWTQPAGDAHITAASGETNIAYIEIDSGPYLVRPTDQSFDTGEREINVDRSNIVWLDARALKWIKQGKGRADKDQAKVAFLWGDPDSGKPSGTMLKLPSSFSGTLQATGTFLHAVVIEGELLSSQPNQSAVSLAPGSYIGATDANGLHFSLATTAGSILYIRTDGAYHID